MLERLGDIQLALRDEDLAGWLLVSASGVNRLAERLLAIDPEACRRRWFYWIPADGIPVLLAHRAEVGRFPSLPGELIAFRSWSDLRDGLERTLPDEGPVAMEHSPMGLDPELGRVDGGTIALVQSYGPRVVSSEAIARRLLSRWSEAELEGHRESATALEALLDASFEWLASAIASGRPPTERRLRARVEELADARGLSLATPPRVASGANTCDPTHVATDANDDPVTAGDVVLLTVGGVKRGGAAAEVGHVAYVGESVPREIAEGYAALRRAIETATELVAARATSGRRVLGFEVDRASRDVLASAGHRDQVVHRLGHGLAVDGTVAPGTQLDGLEMHDTRPLEPGRVFVLHPGIYHRERWGMRLTTCFVVADGGDVRISSQIRPEPRLL